MIVLNQKKSIEIDLKSEQGNAFYLLGLARNLGKKIGMSPTELNNLRSRMTSSDYDNLIKEFDNAFGDFVKIYK